MLITREDFRKKTMEIVKGKYNLKEQEIKAYKEGKRDHPQCPECKSCMWTPVMPFDYIKQCDNCGIEFSANPHN